MSEDATTHDPRTTTHEDEEISLLDLLIVLVEHKKLVLGLPFGVAVVAAAISLLMPNIYTGVARILPPQQNHSAAVALLGQLGTQAGFLGGLAGGALGIKNPNDLYVGMLKSRTGADGLIRRFDLQNIYEVKYVTDARKALETVTRITPGRDGIITIEVDDRSPKRAADLANAYVEELYKFTQTLAVTEASQRRLFFERQLDQARQNLANAEVSARKGLEKGGLVVVDAQGRAMAETTARLRGQITAKEVQIGAMRAFASGRNPDLQQAQHELDAMKQELAKMEGIVSGRNTADRPGQGDGMENLRLLRDVKYYETIFDLLSKQYEIAKIDEAKDASLIQVLDKAIEPERKSKPYRALLVVITAVLAFIFVVTWVLAREAYNQKLSDPGEARKLRRLRDGMRLR